MINEYPQATDPQNNPSHSQLHRDEIDAINDIESGDLALKKIKLDTTAGEPAVYEKGQMYWDDLNHTVVIQTGIGDNKLQINQEIPTVVGNESGTDFVDGQVVRISGVSATGIPLVTLAKADSITNSDLIGVLTADLPSGVGNESFAVIIGVVNELDTSTFLQNDTLYLSETTAGAFTKTKPTSPNYVRPVAKVLRVDATNGSILVNTTISRGMDAEQIFEDMLGPNGFPEGQKTNVGLSYNFNTRQVTVSGTFYYYSKGVKYIKTAVSEVITHNDTIGGHFIYYDGNTLTYSTTSWNFLLHVPVAYVFYNNTAATTFWSGKEGILFDERHGMIMTSATHKELHETTGTYVVGSGFALNGTYSVATGSGGLVANSYGVDSGTIADEDLETSIATLNDNAGVGNQYPIFYRTGASGEWRWFVNNVPYLFTSTNIVWNQNNAGTWQLTPSTTNGRYINMYVCAVPSLNSTYRFIWLISQIEHTSLVNAQNESVLSLDLAGLPFQEIAPLWQVTMRRENSYNDNGNCRIESTRRIVGTRLSTTTSSVSPTIHNNLSGRADADTHPASSITNTPAGNISAITVQAAIDELDTEKQSKINDGSVTVNFGTEDSFITTSVTDANVTSTSKILCYVLGESTTNHDAEDYGVESITAYASNITNGSFDLVCYTANGLMTFGQYKINYIIK